MFRVGDQIQVVAGLRGGKIAPDGPQLGEVYTVTGIRATSTEDRAVRLDRAVGGYSKGTYWSISRFNLVVKAMVLYPGDKVRVIAGSQFLSVGELLTVVEVYTDYGYGNTETGLYRHFVIADVEKLMEPLDEGKTAEPGETLDSFKAKVYEVAQGAKTKYGWCGAIDGILSDLGVEAPPKLMRTFILDIPIEVETTEDLSQIPGGELTHGSVLEVVKAIMALKFAYGHPSAKFSAKHFNSWTFTEVE